MLHRPPSPTQCTPIPSKPTIKCFTYIFSRFLCYPVAAGSFVSLSLFFLFLCLTITNQPTYILRLMIHTYYICTADIHTWHPFFFCCWLGCVRSLTLPRFSSLPDANARFLSFPPSILGSILSSHANSSFTHYARTHSLTLISFIHLSEPHTTLIYYHTPACLVHPRTYPHPTKYIDGRSLAPA
ncbi:hypothetical protein B0H13DRAFT_379538 [Mycena leptocephala]|nr:hypothetical protein B0H13DRAFT_379538 [Mycena leptocephala]